MQLNIRYADFEPEHSVEEKEITLNAFIDKLVNFDWTSTVLWTDKIRDNLFCTMVLHNEEFFSNLVIQKEFDGKNFYFNVLYLSSIPMPAIIELDNSSPFKAESIENVIPIVTAFFNHDTNTLKKYFIESKN